MANTADSESFWSRWQIVLLPLALAVAFAVGLTLYDEYVTPEPGPAVELTRNEAALTLTTLNVRLGWDFESGAEACFMLDVWVEEYGPERTADLLVAWGLTLDEIVAYADLCSSEWGR